MMAPETTVVTVETNKPAQPQGAPPTQQGALDWVRVNIDHFKTLPGILKIVELALGILCMVLATPAYHSGTHWFLFVAVVSFIGTLIWTVVYLISIREAARFPINWPLTELFNTGLTTLFYFIAFIAQFSAASRFVNTQIYGYYTAAAVFGMLNTLVYAASTYFVYVEHRSSPANP